MKHCMGCGRKDGTPDVDVEGTLCLTCHACFLNWAQDFKQPTGKVGLFGVLDLKRPGVLRSFERWIARFDCTLKNKANPWTPQLTRGPHE